jgi:hypothetical protein
MNQKIHTIAEDHLSAQHEAFDFGSTHLSSSPIKPQTHLDDIQMPDWLHTPLDTEPFQLIESPGPTAGTPENKATGEQAIRTHKLGRFIGRASLRVARVMDKVVTKMGAASVLYPGSALNFADLTNEIEKNEIAKREIFGTFERQGYIKMAPRFRDQIDDATRTNTFRYARTASGVKADKSRPDVAVEMTEHEGLVGLDRFLKEFIQQSQGDSREASRRKVAEAMLENLTFIGSREYAEAARGIGDYWKAYLDEDPDRQICVPMNISRIWTGRKSDVYLFETVIDGFNDNDLERYSGRILTDLEDVTVQPDKLKVVLLDDWTISGSQMQAAYRDIKDSRSGTRMYADRVEINLLTASAERIRNGLPERLWGDNLPTIPLRAYFVSHEAPDTTGYDQNAHITGTHSSVDFDFEEPIRRMVKYIDSKSGKHAEDEAKAGQPSRISDAKHDRMPPLTNILRVYYGAAPKVEVQRDRIVRKDRTIA